MTTKSLFRAGLSCLLVALAGACSNSDDGTGGGLLGGGTGIPGAPSVGTLTITGPSVVAPGVDTAGFTATLKSGVTAIPLDSLTITTTAGTVSTYSSTGMEQVGNSTAKTNSQGQVIFNYEAPNTITMTSSATISVSSADFVDMNGKPLVQTFVVSISPATFKFISPNPNTTIIVGSANEVPLHFQWTNPSVASGSGAVGTVGVAGSIDLTVSPTSGAGNNGATTTALGPVLVINGSPQNQTATPTANVMTAVDSDGDFVANVQVYNNNRGFATITATNHADINQTATITLQFADQATSSDLVADPLAIPPATTQDSTSALTYTVDNQSNQPIGGVDVTFTLLNPTGGNNERIFPLGGTTDQNGQVASKYYAGDKTGVVTVEACVNGTSVCDMRQITISSTATGTTTTPTTTGNVALAGPNNIGEFTVYNNFTAVLTDSTGAPVSGVFLNLSPTKGGGNIFAPPGSANENSGGAMTDSNGEVAFSYVNNAATSAPASVIITGSAIVAGTQVSKTFTLTVNPDTFQFTQPAAPASGASATVLKTGTGNESPISFNWMRLFETSATSTTTALEPFGGPVNLSVNGSAKIVIPGASDSNNGTVSTDNTGHFPTGIEIYDLTAESVVLTATDGNSFGFTTTVPLQFVSP